MTINYIRELNNFSYNKARIVCLRNEQAARKRRRWIKIPTLALTKKNLRATNITNSRAIQSIHVELSWWHLRSHDSSLMTSERQGVESFGIHVGIVLVTADAFDRNDPVFH